MVIMNDYNESNRLACNDDLVNYDANNLKWNILRYIYCLVISLFSVVFTECCDVVQ